MNLKGKTAVITGAARGIGLAVAHKLASAGCNVVLSDIMQDSLEEAQRSIPAHGVDALTVRTDVSSLSDAEALMAATLDKFGRIDILVNNAGITRDNLLMKMDEKDWDAVMAVNLKGTFNCTKAAIRPMMKQRAGKIINLASIVGLIGNAGQANYSASKAGIIGLTKSVAKELGSRNVQVNAIAPGFIATEMTENLPQGAKDAFLKNIPLKRAGQVEDVANIVLFLSSELSDYVTGQVINVDGGMVM